MNFPPNNTPGHFVSGTIRNWKVIFWQAISLFRPKVEFSKLNHMNFSYCRSTCICVTLMDFELFTNKKVSQKYVSKIYHILIPLAPPWRKQRVHLGRRDTGGGGGRLGVKITPSSYISRFLRFLAEDEQVCEKKLQQLCHVCTFARVGGIRKHLRLKIDATRTLSLN